MRKAKAAAAVRPPHKSLMKQVLKHWEFYLLLLPGIIITIIFKYVPIYGVQIAFRDYNPVGGFFGSPWVGLKWFERFFNSYNSVRMIRNTVLLSLYSILWTFPIPIILALLINQVKSKKFQRVTQTIIYAPHFISIMILCGMLRIFLSPYGGLINIIAQALGAPEAINFIDEASAFRTIYIASSIWQDAGWGTIIYLATLSSVDASLHEAAKVDGASGLQIDLKIKLPLLKPMIGTVAVIAANYGLLLYNEIALISGGGPDNATFSLSYYVYKTALGSTKLNFARGNAAGVIQMLLGIILVGMINWFFHRRRKEDML